MTNANSVTWGALRGRDLVAGFGFFIFLNTALLALIVLGADVLGDEGFASNLGIDDLQFILTHTIDDDEMNEEKEKAAKAAKPAKKAAKKQSKDNL